MKLVLVLLLLLLLLPGCLAQQPEKTVFVDAPLDGGGGACPSSPGDPPSCNLRAALQLQGPGATLRAVLQAPYHVLAKPLTVNESVVIESADPQQPATVFPSAQPLTVTGFGALRLRAVALDGNGTRFYGQDSALLVQANASLAVEGCNFTRLVAHQQSTYSAVTYGGAITSWGRLAVANSAFSGCVSDASAGYNPGASGAYAKATGGAVASFSDSAAELTNCTFDGNTASASASARFSATAVSLGGAVYAQNLTLRGCVFRNNSAGRGSAVWAAALRTAADAGTEVVFAANSGGYKEALSAGAGAELFNVRTDGAQKLVFALAPAAVVGGAWGPGTALVVANLTAGPLPTCATAAGEGACAGATRCRDVADGAGAAAGGGIACDCADGASRVNATTCL